jgi:hypothetical protein
MTYINTVPFSRINENWVNDTIDYRPSNEIYKHPLIQGEPNLPSMRYQAPFYKNFAVDIVAETVYNYPYPYITEKTLRPIACKKLFIIVGSPRSLAILHSKGFKTFPDVFDESYDTLIDPIQRWHALEKVIIQFMSKSLDEIKEIVLSKRDTLEKNFLTLKNLQVEELKALHDTN